MASGPSGFASEDTEINTVIKVRFGIPNAARKPVLG